MCHFLEPIMELSQNISATALKFWRFSAIPPLFLQSSILFFIKATTMPNYSAVAHILAEFHALFQKVAHQFNRYYIIVMQKVCRDYTFHLKNIHYNFQNNLP